MTKLNIDYLKDFKNAGVGLIGAKNPRNIMFKTRFGIHTFFLKFPIDVLILDENNKVVKIKEGLKPNRIFVWNPRFNKVIELPNGEVGMLKIKIGTIISLNFL